MNPLFHKVMRLLTVYQLLAIWTPVFWFISSARDRHGMIMFDFLKLGWFEMLWGAFLISASFISQFAIFLYKGEKKEDSY